MPILKPFYIFPPRRIAGDRSLLCHIDLSLCLRGGARNIVKCYWRVAAAEQCGMGPGTNRKRCYASGRKSYILEGKLEMYRTHGNKLSSPLFDRFPPTQATNLFSNEDESPCRERENRIIASFRVHDWGKKSFSLTRALP